MTRQRGQSLVEFALIIPLFALFLFGLIYGGLMFYQYFNLSNDSRATARQYAVMTEPQIKQALGDPLPTVANPKVVTGERRFGTFYNVTQKIWIEYDESTTPHVAKDVVVRVEFNRSNNDLPRILAMFNWPPETFAMNYRMKLEAKNLTSGE